MPTLHRRLAGRWIYRSRISLRQSLLCRDCGGFIGVELMENLRELGIDVTVVQRPRQLLNPLDADMAAFLHAKLRQKGVRLHLGCTVEGFAANGDRVNPPAQATRVKLS